MRLKNYVLRQQYISYILVVSLYIQSCHAHYRAIGQTAPLTLSLHDTLNVNLQENQQPYKVVALPTSYPPIDKDPPITTRKSRHQLTDKVNPSGQNHQESREAPASWIKAGASLLLSAPSFIAKPLVGFWFKLEVVLLVGTIYIPALVMAQIGGVIKRGFAAMLPSKLPTPSYTLHTIRFSHFCEKGRWALDILRHIEDRRGIQALNSFDYVEVNHPPVTHAVPILFRSLKRATSTPLFEISNGTSEHVVIQESDDILEWADRRLQASSPLAAIKENPNTEKVIADTTYEWPIHSGFTLYPAEHQKEIFFLQSQMNQIGEYVRLICYFKYFDAIFHSSHPQHKKSITVLREAFLNGINSPLERFFVDHFFLQSLFLMRLGLNITQSNVVNVMEKLMESMNLIEERLQTNRQKKVAAEKKDDVTFFLFDNVGSPTAADISAASLLYCIVLPPEMDEIFCPLHPASLGPHVFEFFTSFQSHYPIITEYVKKMYSFYRTVDIVRPR